MKYRTGDNEQGLRELARRVVMDHYKYRESPPPTILEIGSFVGDSTRIFIEEIKPLYVVCVDPWDEQMPGFHVEGGEIFSAFIGNVEPAADAADCILYPIRKTSGEYFAAADPRHAGPFDLVYIDAVHTRDAVAEDIAGALPLLRSEGVLAGHDYCPRNFPGVVEAVDRALRVYGARFSHLEVYRDTSFALIPRSA